MPSGLFKSRDILGGVLIVVVGAAFLYLAKDLDFGTSRRMGPGYFPIAMSAMLMALGLLLIGTEVYRKKVESVGREGLELRSLVQIVGATALFGACVRGLGVLPALAVTVFLSATASRFNDSKMALLLTVCITAFCIVVFVVALGLPLQLFGPWIDYRSWFADRAAAPVTSWILRGTAWA